MFNGIIRATGKVVSSQSVSESKTLFQISVPEGFLPKDLAFNDSLAINGLCLSVEDFGVDFIKVRITPIRLEESAGFALESTVNLEHTLRLGDKFNGYFFSGITDTVAIVTDINKIGEYTHFTFKLTQKFTPYLVKNGLVMLNGVVVTVIDVKHSINSDLDVEFTATLLPHTLEWSNFKYASLGTPVNVEFDQVTRVVANYMQNWQAMKDTSC